MRHFAILIFLMAKIGSGIAQDIQSPLPPRTMHEGYVISSGGDNYKPKDLKCYRVGEIQYVTVPFSGKGFSRNKSFMIRLSKGPVSLYQWYYDESLMIDSQE